MLRAFSGDTMAAAKTVEKKEMPKMTLMQEFMGFLREYKILALAIAFIIGVALTTLVNALVKDIIMPIVTPFIPGGGWQTATFKLGPFTIAWGDFAANVLNFIIIALVVFLIAKKAMKEEKVGKK
jgi:large conductance mechanosensitive channel